MPDVGMRRKAMVWTLVALALVAGAFPAVITLLYSRALIFHPTSLSSIDVDALAARPGWSRVSLEVEPGVRVVGLIRAASSSAAPQLLFFGGNAYDLASSQLVLEEIGAGHDFGLAVFAYRGYDGSGGAPSEVSLFADARKAADHLEAAFGVAPDRLVLVGQSLGSGVAAHLAGDLSAASRPPRALIMISPYTAIADLFEQRVPIVPVGWAVRDPFRTISAIDRVRCPVLLVHGDRDRLIPVSHARALKERLGDRARLVVLEGRDHNDLWEGSETSKAISELIANH
jgi:uncharacterized protein